MIIFDLEGVLIDNKDRYIFAVKKADPNASSDKDLSREKRRVFWQTFFDVNLVEKMDRVNMTGLRILKRLVEKGKKIVILSGTKKEIVKILLNKIMSEAEKMGFKFKPLAVVWRPKNDYRKSRIFKKEKALELVKMFNEEIEEIHDDDEEVINEFKKMGIKTVLWRDLKPENYPDNSTSPN